LCRYNVLMREVVKEVKEAKGYDKVVGCTS
jgi:hypothetical protein